MEDFPLLLLIFIFYLIAGSSKKKKNTKHSHSKARSGPMRARSQGEQADNRAQSRDRQTMAGFETAFAGAIDQATDKKHAPCEEKPIHLHEVTQAQLRDAVEGDDPCHLGGESMLETVAADAAWSETDETQEALRQDVLRGVIMSEILMRPQERRAMQRSRREYHGY
ncbi:MAG: hypothetical protein IJ313_12115 [Clostridia bacterium]|nr:hypothetical protein [Clostridia bacterium]